MTICIVQVPYLYWIQYSNHDTNRLHVMTSPLIPVFTEFGSVCLDRMKWNSKTVYNRTLHMLSNTCTTHTLRDKQATYCKLFFSHVLYPLPLSYCPSLQVPRHIYQWIPVHIFCKLIMYKCLFALFWKPQHVCLNWLYAKNMTLSKMDTVKINY
jgi:hypothetical protein